MAVGCFVRRECDSDRRECYFVMQECYFVMQECYFVRRECGFVIGECVFVLVYFVVVEKIAFLSFQCDCSQQSNISYS